MRLIDADEVKKYIHDLMLNNVDRYTDKEMTQYDNLIDSCRTVKAIPIEWIEEWQNRHEWQYESYFAMRDGRPKYAIECLLEDWEKENDKQ